MSISRKILYIQRKSPFAGSEAFESVEGILMAGVFEQSVSVLFMDEGVHQLVGMDAQSLGVRNVNKLCASLGLYDISRLYVAENSLGQRGLSSEQLSVPATVLGAEDVSGLISQHDIVISS